MRTQENKIWILIVVLLTLTMPAEAQLLKGFGKKLENKIENRIERKADKQVDKVLDKADKKTDESINDALNKPKTDSKKKTVKSSVPLEQVAARPDQTLVLMENSCTDFSWFKKGTVLKYESIDNKGRVEAQMEMKVRDLKSKGTATVAEVDAKMSSPSFGDLSYTMNYICDGGMLYMDIASMMQAIMESHPEMKNEAVQNAVKNTEIDFDNGFAGFPKKMYPGMQLDDLNFSFKTNAASAEMSFNTTVTGRQVLARETVTTKAGTFDCLKIKSTTNTSLKVMGINQKMPSSTEYLWIAPVVGMVKQETHAAKEVTAMQLTAYN